MEPPRTGSSGRTVTHLAPSGVVDVGGTLFQAETSLFGTESDRPSVPPERAVVVSGWRADERHGVILLVTDPTAPALLPSQDPEPPPLTPEERIQSLERQLEHLRTGPPAPPVWSPGIECVSCGGPASRACSGCGRFCCEGHITRLHPIRFAGGVCESCAVQGWVGALIGFIVVGLVWLFAFGTFPNR